MKCKVFTDFKNSIAAIARKTRIVDVRYNASNNELVRTKTLVKNAIIEIDATPFRQWYESYYALPLGRKSTSIVVSMYVWQAGSVMTHSLCLTLS